VKQLLECGGGSAAEEGGAGDLWLADYGWDTVTDRVLAALHI